MRERYYVNLTNGLEILSERPDIHWHFIRIQSTAAEQKRWNDILYDLDYDFLFNLAQGNVVLVYDFGKKGETRALWQAIKWIEYALNRRWFNIHKIVIVKQHNVVNYYDEQYKKLTKRVKNKLDYFKKFLNTDEVNILTKGYKTIFDGQYVHYNKLAKEYNEDNKE